MSEMMKNNGMWNEKYTTPDQQTVMCVPKQLVVYRNLVANRVQSV